MHLAIQTNISRDTLLDMTLPELQAEFDNYNKLVEEYKRARKDR